MAIPFTQYLRPDGRKKAVEIDCSAEIEALAESFIAAGGRYECEHLTTNYASFTAAYRVDGEDQDIAIEVVPNGPPVVDAVTRLVRASVKYLEDKIPSGSVTIED